MSILVSTVLTNVNTLLNDAGHGRADLHLHPDGDGSGYGRHG